MGCDYTLQRVVSHEQMMAYLMFQWSYKQFGCSPVELDSEQSHRVRQKALRQLRIEQAVLNSQEAEGISISAVELKESVEEIRGRYNGEVSEKDCLFHNDLTMNGLNEQTLNEALSRQLLVDAIVERVVDRMPDISDTDVSLYYYLHWEDFLVPELRVARHILITTNETFPENQLVVAQKRLNEICAQLHRNPEQFAALAMRYSECPSAMQGGLLGTVRRGQLYPELGTALFALTEGTVSSVIRTEVGLHVLRCDEVLPERHMKLDDIFLRLRTQLRTRHRQMQQKKWLNSLMANAEVLPNSSLRAE